jgi:DNA-binding Lrp family transcriptional regulator
MIIALFESDPGIAQAEIAQQVGLSQPTVGARILKLRQSGVITSTVGMDLKKIGLNRAKVDLTTQDSNNIINHFIKCPYFMNGMIVSGQKNLLLFFAAEDIGTLEAVVDKHLRSNPAVSNVDLGIIISSVKDVIKPVKMTLEKRDISPCGFNCLECQYYTSERCLGCPATTHYKGNFW